MKNKDEKKIKLERKISLFNGINVIVGSIIGSGIFISPKGVLQEVGSVGLSLVIWLACGLFSMIGAYCYTELGTLINKSGADYAYINEAFGPFFAFLRIWVECMIVRPCSTAIIALTFSSYVIEPFFPECSQPDLSVKCVAVLCISILTLVNCYDVKWAMRVQDLFTLAKLLALILIIFTGLYQIIDGSISNFTYLFRNSKVTMGSIAISFYQGLFAYNGWNFLNYVIEELKNPYKNLPRATWISIILVTTIYFLVNVAYFAVMTTDEMLVSDAVAVLFAHKMYGFMAWIMPVFVALSTFGGVNGILFTTSRLFYVGSREGHMPELLCYVHINKLTPAPAVIFMGLFSCCYLISSDIYRLINYISFVNWLSIGLSIVALLVFRKTKRDAFRPIKVWIFWPIIYIFVTIFIIIVPIYYNPYETGMGCIIIITGIPVFLIFVFCEKKPKNFQRKIDYISSFIQKLLLVVPEEIDEIK